MVLFADALRNAGDVEEAFAVLDEAATLVDQTGECYYEAEIHRLRGTLLLGSKRRGNRSKAARSLRTALEIATNQQAKSLQLNAARDIAALWAEDGKHQQAHDLLTSVYETFSEGLDMPALASSRQLLDELQ
jgi:predicted ATPase